MIGGAMLLLPGYLAGALVVYSFSLKSLSSFNFHNYISFLGFIDRIPNFEKLFFIVIFIGITFLLYEKTQWGEMTKKVLPFRHINDYE